MHVCVLIAGGSPCVSSRCTGFKKGGAMRFKETECSDQMFVLSGDFEVIVVSGISEWIWIE